MSTFSSISSSHDIINLRLSPQFRLAANGEMSLEKLAHIGIRVAQVAEKQSLFFAGYHAGREKSCGQSLYAEIALLHNSFGPGRKSGVDFLDKRPGVSIIHGPGSIGASGNAEAASNASMIIHHDDSVLCPLEGRLRRTHPDTGRVFTMIAEDKDRSLLDTGLDVRMFLARESIPKPFRPYPFNLILLVAEIWNIMDIVAGLDAIRTAMGTSL
jgi:hypothetical protein